MSGRSRPPRSLQAKALQLLAQREQSRVELRRKLLAHARAADKLAAEQARLLSVDGALSIGFDRAGDRDEKVDRDSSANADGAGGHDREDRPATDDRPPSVEARVDAVMAWLEAHHFSSDERFAESRIHARQSRFGNLRIRQELATHAIELSADAARKLAASELQRALDICEHKFATAPAERAESARQGRFLIARGFAADTVRQVLRLRMKRLADDGLADDV